MVKPCLVAFQTGHNLPQARRSAQLAVQQGDQVPLRRQFTRQLVGPILLNNLLQLRPRHVLQQTVKYAILMQHGVASFSCLGRGQTLETQKNPCHAPYQPKSNRTAVGQPGNDGCASSCRMRRYREPFPVLLRPAIGVAPVRLLSVRRGVTERRMDDGEVAHDADLYIMRLQILDPHRLRGVSRHRPASDRWCDRHRVYANSQLRRLRPPAFGSLLDAVVSICPVHGDDDHRRYSCCADS